MIPFSADWVTQRRSLGMESSFWVGERRDFPILSIERHNMDFRVAASTWSSNFAVGGFRHRGTCTVAVAVPFVYAVALVYAKAFVYANILSVEVEMSSKRSYDGIG
jgi:hypothetical protein